MDRKLTSRIASFGLFASFLALVWMLRLSLMLQPHPPAVIVPPVSTRVVMAKPRPRRSVAALPKVTVDPNAVPLHSIQREYTYVFTGQVTCGDTPCRDAEVKVHIQTGQNPGIVKEAAMSPDGNYSVAVLFREAPHQQIVWRISADSKESEAQELHGQQILEDEPQIVVEEPIRLL